CGPDFGQVQHGFDDAIVARHERHIQELFRLGRVIIQIVDQVSKQWQYLKNKSRQSREGNGRKRTSPVCSVTSGWQLLQQLKGFESNRLWLESFSSQHPA